MSAKQALDAVAAIAANTDLSAEASAAFALGHVAGQAEQAAAAPKSKPLLIYWGGIAARAHYYCYVLGYHGLLDEVELKTDAPWPGTPGWDAYPRSKVGQLPAMQDGAANIGQSTAIVNYLARKFGLDTDLSLADYATSQELIQQAADIHALLAGAHYAADRTVGMDALFAEGGKIGQVLAAFEPYICSSGFFGSVVTPGDLCLGASLNLLTRLQPDCLAKYPKLAAMNDVLQSHEGIQAVNTGAPNSYFKRNSD